MLTATAITKDYDTARGRVPVLTGVSLSLAPGGALAVVGPSGCGKSTLLHVLGALDPPSSGTVTLDGVNAFTLSEPEQAAFRGRHVGFVFQDHLLLPQLSALDNVLVPTLVEPAREGASRDARARELLAAVGLSARIDHRPAELSGGERQRVAIARALIRDPRLLLCDEPTGNLDRASADAVMDLLLDLHARQATMLIVVTHSAELAARLPRRGEMRDGQLHVPA